MLQGKLAELPEAISHHNLVGAMNVEAELVQEAVKRDPKALLTFLEEKFGKLDDLRDRHFREVRHWAFPMGPPN